MRSLKPRSLSAKLSLGFLTLALLFSAFQLIALYQLWKSSVLEIRQRTYWNLAENLAEEIRPLLEQYPISHPKVKEMLFRFEKRHPGEDVMLIDPQGHLLGSNPELRVVSAETIEEFLTPNPRRRLPLYAYKWNGHPTIFSVAPVRVLNEDGFLFVDLFGGGSEAVSAGVGDRVMFLGGIVVSLLVAAVLSLLGLSVIAIATKRLRASIAVVRRYSEGESQARITHTGEDEVAMLGREFNRMADTISANLNALRQNDEERRELIAQISHDLGTPVATAQTSLESLFQVDSPLDPSVKEERVAAALRSVTKVRRLCSDLLELSKMELAAVHPRSEIVNLEEMLTEDILPRVKVLAQDCATKISLAFPEEDIFVLTDIGMLQRILDNLIENAIRYSGGEVRIEVARTSDPDYCQVSINDSGPGIPERELSLLSKQFYRSESAREKNPGGSGIGLAAVKRLLQAQGLELTIESETGKGSSFSFHLPLDRSE